MNFDPKAYDPIVLQSLYEALLWPRLIEEKMLILLRQSKISKWFSGIGQEAIAGISGYYFVTARCRPAG